jgi:hypothetical protein
VIGVGDILNHQTEEIAKLRQAIALREAKIFALQEELRWYDLQLARLIPIPPD